MQLTRREFAAATAGGLSLFSFAAAPAVADETIRHAHLELPAGPYARAEISRLVACAADVAGLPAPDAITALGTRPEAAEFPKTFVLTLQFSGTALVVRASQQHVGAPELTLRGKHFAFDLRYSQKRIAFQPH